MEIMIWKTNLSQLYSELSLNPDLPTLAERCKLLTEILLDCTSLPQTQPVCRCLGAYLEEVKTGLTESMCDFQVVEFEAKKNGRKKSGCWKILKPNAITAGH
jgi:hypothetical protein